MPPPTPPSPGRDASQAASTMAPNKEENAYIPHFISKRPFYAGSGEEADYLDHQRIQKQKQESTWYDRGKKGASATKYRKGACENCGAMGHQAKGCLERPRKKGAKYTGKDIQADDVVQEVQLSWDAKRDRWNGFEARDYSVVVEEHSQVEALRRAARRKEAGEGEGGDDEDTDGDGPGGDAGDKYAEESDMSKHQPTSTRQLRIREDTAKYLLNLDLESARYDPKTRRLVDAGAADDKAAELFAEQGFVRVSGDAAEFERATRYAWEAQERKGDTSLHLQGNPTAGEFSRKREAEEAEARRRRREEELREMYGDGAAGAGSVPDALREMATATENEHFVEYDEHGLVKGAKASARSKYPEDIFPNNHSSVWGSWWSDFQWGYECCHSTIKNSYCTGEDGKRAWEASERQRTGVNLIEEAGGAGSNKEEEVEEVEAAAGGDRQDEGEDEGKEDKQNLKRTREEMASGITEEELDAYRRKRTAADDPMAKFLGRDELI